MSCRRVTFLICPLITPMIINRQFSLFSLFRKKLCLRYIITFKVMMELFPCLSATIRRHMAGVKTQFLAFLTLARDGGECSASSPGCSTSGETDSDTHWLGRWVCYIRNVGDGNRRRVCQLYLAISPVSPRSDMSIILVNTTTSVYELAKTCSLSALRYSVT